jgi:putative transposase
MMREKGLKGAQKRRFRCTTDSRHPWPIAPNRLDRNFDPVEANRVWAGDVTYIATEQGWLYLAVILDLFSRRVVGWSVSPMNDTKLAQEALRSALMARRPELGLLHHAYSAAFDQPFRKHPITHSEGSDQSRSGATSGGEG